MPVVAPDRGQISITSAERLVEPTARSSAPPQTSRRRSEVRKPSTTSALRSGISKSCATTSRKPRVQSRRARPTCLGAHALEQAASGRQSGGMAAAPPQQCLWGSARCERGGGGCRRRLLKCTSNVDRPQPPSSRSPRGWPTSGAIGGSGGVPGARFSAIRSCHGETAKPSALRALRWSPATWVALLLSFERRNEGLGV